VPVPSTPCTDGELRAAVFSSGPFIAMATHQEIITVSSSTLCRLDGYPTLLFGAPAHPEPVAVQHDGVVGHQASPKPVAVGTATPASFLVQSAMGPVNPKCVETNLLTIGAPDSAPSVSVLLPTGGVGPAWYLCGQVEVTPFEQGNTLDQYA
jgi:hypothetical protein